MRYAENAKEDNLKTSPIWEKSKAEILKTFELKIKMRNFLFISYTIFATEWDFEENRQIGVSKVWGGTEGGNGYGNDLYQGEDEKTGYNRVLLETIDDLKRIYTNLNFYDKKNLKFSGIFIKYYEIGSKRVIINREIPLIKGRTTII